MGVAALEQVTAFYLNVVALRFPRHRFLALLEMRFLRVVGAKLRNNCRMLRGLANSNRSPAKYPELARSVT